MKSVSWADDAKSDMGKNDDFLCVYNGQLGLPGRRNNRYLANVCGLKAQ